MPSLQKFFALGAFVIVITVALPRESAGQMHGIPGAPQGRMGGSGIQRPMAGSSVPMMGRQGPMRQAQSFGSASRAPSRFGGQFSAGAVTAQARSVGGGAMGGGNAASTVKSQAMSVGRGGFGF